MARPTTLERLQKAIASGDLELAKELTTKLASKEKGLLKQAKVKPSGVVERNPTLPKKKSSPAKKKEPIGDGLIGDSGNMPGGPIESWINPPEPSKEIRENYQKRKGQSLEGVTSARNTTIGNANKNYAQDGGSVYNPNRKINFFDQRSSPDRVVPKSEKDKIINDKVSDILVQGLEPSARRDPALKITMVCIKCKNSFEVYWSQVQKSEYGICDFLCVGCTPKG